MEVEKSRYGEEADSGDENKDRGNWSGRFDFFLSCLGYAVGLGNVWRFPYLCYKNGGGAFFVPYCIFLFFVGIPVFLIELTLGQFSSEGTLTCWRYCPLFQGVGVGMFVVSCMVAIYYNMIITWAIWYLFSSFRSVLPWTTCGHWSSSLCRDNLLNITGAQCNATAGLVAKTNGVCYNSTTNAIVAIFDEATARNNSIQKLMPANDYLNYIGLQVKKSGSWNNFGAPRWDMTLCLLLAWIIIFICMSRGIKSSGKVVYFTALFPYVVLIILFIRGLMLDGYLDGIKFYIIPKPERLVDATVWKDAAVQIFFSLSVSWGGLMSLSSYNKFHTDVVRDTITVCLGNCLTSVFAGFVIFSYLGAFAKSIGAPVDTVVESGVALAFIVYPQAMTTMPISPLWSILFFLMLITLGLDSEFATMETIVTGLVDYFPKLRKLKLFLLLVFCIVFFLLGLPMTTPGGPYLVTLMDDYCGGWSIMLIATMECVSVAYLYGAARFAADIETMIGKNCLGCVPWRYFKWPWIICWSIISPLLVVTILIFSLVKHTGSSYGSYIFPQWVNAIGWVITVSVVFAIFTTMIVKIILTEGTFLQRMRTLTKPDRLWGPYLVKHRRLVTYARDFELNPRGLPDDYSKSEDNPAYTRSGEDFSKF